MTSLGAVNEAAALVQRVLPALTVDEGLEFAGALAVSGRLHPEPIFRQFGPL